MAVSVTKAKTQVLMVHQSAELYGSDKVLLNIASALCRGEVILPIVVVPSTGPLVEMLKGSGVEVIVGPVGKLSRRAFSVRGILPFLIEVVRSTVWLSSVIRTYRVQIVHSNTIAVLGGAIAARLSGIPHVWHVHELVTKPAVMRRSLPKLVNLLSQRVVSISNMVTAWLIDNAPSVKERTRTIWNGLPQRPPINTTAVKRFRESLGIQKDGTPLIAFVGRFNRWKGQAVLVDAMAILRSRGYTDIRAVLVGGPPPGEPEHLVELLAQVDRRNCGDVVTVRSFTNDVWTIWDACDVAVVPSIEPEPFGLVAIEAMASEKAVVATAHGGLLDIVQPNESGLLIAPGDPVLLADALQLLIDNPTLRGSLGKQGLDRQVKLFSLERQVQELTACYEELLTRSVQG